MGGISGGGMLGISETLSGLVSSITGQQPAKSAAPNVNALRSKIRSSLMTSM
jgi:hypothetical protein